MESKKNIISVVSNGTTASTWRSNGRCFQSLQSPIYRLPITRLYLKFDGALMIIYSR